MTWSIVARDAATDAFGIAIASKAFAVGAMCPYVGSGAGAISSQAMSNPYLGVWGIRLLRSGAPAADRDRGARSRRPRPRRAPAPRSRRLRA